MNTQSNLIKEESGPGQDSGCVIPSKTNPIANLNCRAPAGRYTLLISSLCDH